MFRHHVRLRCTIGEEDCIVAVVDFSQQCVFFSLEALHISCGRRHSVFKPFQTLSVLFQYFDSCDGCQQNPIQGARYHKRGSDFDLCHACFRQQCKVYKQAVEFERVSVPGTTPAPLLLRLNRRHGPGMSTPLTLFCCVRKCIDIMQLCTGEN